MRGRVRRVHYLHPIGCPPHLIIVEGIAIGLIVLFLLCALGVLAAFFWQEPTNGWREAEVLIALGGALIALAWWMGYSA